MQHFSFVMCTFIFYVKKFYVWPLCLQVYLCTMCTQLRDQKRASDSLGLESKTVVSYSEGAGNGTCVLQNQPILLTAEP